MSERIELRWTRQSDGKTRMAYLDGLTFTEALRVFHCFEDLIQQVKEDEMGEPGGSA